MVFCNSERFDLWGRDDYIGVSSSLFDLGIYVTKRAADREPSWKDSLRADDDLFLLVLTAIRNCGCSSIRDINAKKITNKSSLLHRQSFFFHFHHLVCDPYLVGKF